MRAVLAMFGAAVLVASARAADAPTEPIVETEEPRAYGYQVGDLVRRTVHVHVPAGWRLDPDSLPRPGQRGRALELRRVRVLSSDEGEGRLHTLNLEYQVFIAPEAVRTLEIAPLRLRVDGAARTEELRVDAWPVTVAPLVPAQASPRRGLGELQPDRAAPLLDTAPLRLRLQVAAALAALLLAALAALRFGLPWLARRRMPLGRAWRQIRRLRADADDAQWHEACRRLHAALNASAGEVLFEHGLARYVAARPALAPLREELAAFLRRSRNELFALAAREPGDAAWLVALSRRLRDAERDGA